MNLSSSVIGQTGSLAPPPGGYGVTSTTDQSFAPAFDSYLNNFLGNIPGVSQEHITSGLANARVGWGGPFGSGSNPFTAAYQAAINIGNSAGFDFAGSTPYDQGLADQMQQQAIERSPEGQARAADANKSDFVKLRDAGEATAAVYGNYLIPGSGLVSSQLVSKGAQEYLGSDVGRLAMIGSGVAGGVQGNFWGSAGSASAGSGIGEEGSLGGLETAPRVNPDYFTAAGAAAGSGESGALGGIETGPQVSPEGYGLPVPVDMSTFPESFLPPPDLSGISPAQTLSQSGAPVVEAGKNFSGFGQGNSVLSDAKTVLGNIGSSVGGGGGVLGALSIGSGIYGILQARKLRQLAAAGAPPGYTTPGVNAAVGKANAGVDKAVDIAAPWDTTQTPLVGGGTDTGRDIAVKQLSSLLQDPSSISTRPGYQAGLEAVQRAMAAQGYTNSGNELAALQKYGGDFYNNAIAQLSVLSGANQSPSAGASVGISGANTTLNGGQLDLSSILGTGGQGLQAAQLNLNGNVAANDLASKSLASIGYGANGGGGSITPQQLQALMLLARNGGLQ